ncbi:hypothetical protein MHI57_09765 [Cytobacillus sp. FSL K6-0129]|uniref:hypothetical protein n=1 Tax=Cytobacillus sp. FSL K6-0129 TaxID=2921421 RepID=UPI0030F584A1
MNLIIFLVIIFVALIVDFLWLDMESKRWKWLKSQSKPQQILFFTSFLGASMILYFLFGLKFLN